MGRGVLANSVRGGGGGGGLLREAGLPVAEFGVLTRGGKLAGGRIWGAN